MVAGTETTPFCGACGWDYTLQENWREIYQCDACGADLTYTTEDVGPTNPPSVASATGASLSVVFSYTSAPNFDSYDFKYSIDGGDYVILYGSPATDSPITVVAAEGEEVCGQLRGVTDGKPSPWAAEDCATATA